MAALGKQLYERVRVFAEHMAGVGKGLEKAVALYNKAVGSLEQRVLVSVRRFRELGAATGESIEPLAEIERTPRIALPPELLAGDDAAADLPELVAQLEP